MFEVFRILNFDKFYNKLLKQVETTTVKPPTPI